MPDAIVDSHTFIWLATDPLMLSATARDLLKDPTRKMVLSVATGWELAIKYSLGKLKLSVSFEELIVAAPKQALLEWHPMTPAHTLRISNMKRHHGDPFDRLIAAQSLVDDIPVVSADSALDAYGVRRIW